MSPTPALLEVCDLRKSYVDRQGRRVEAVRGVSFQLMPGEVLGIVGESGCGKSTLGRTLMRLTEPDSGSIFLNGDDFLAKSGKALARARRDLQMVFQDPFGSLNPRHKVRTIVGEPLTVHGETGIDAKIPELLARVGLPKEAQDRYPHEFSGGQRQRIAIARALALEPRIIIADEPVSALDVSVQSQIINLIADLKADLGLSMIFISHDLSVIRHVSDRIAVMHAGRFVEVGERERIFRAPEHDYTRQLLAAIPSLKSKRCPDRAPETVAFASSSSPETGRATR